MDQIWCFNPGSAKLFNGLPFGVRSAMLAVAKEILSDVLSVCPKAILTSGFRSPVYNRSIGGAGDSLHQYLCALDFSKTNFDLSSFSKSFSEKYFILEELDHIHVGVKRGS